MDLISRINSAENRFKQMLEEYFASVYDERKLPSHGLAHHRRVWKNARELTLEMDKYRKITDPGLPFTLIIACYLHDAGMAIDAGVKHGHHSMDLCQRFLEINNLNENDYPGLAESILEHDNKEYSTISGRSIVSEILSISDDLDAFGFTGIYRYLEIYLTREVDPDKIGQKIRYNAKKRFEHFEKIFEFNDALIQKHKARYMILDDFFKGYNNQLTDNTMKVAGYCGVSCTIAAMIKEEKDLTEIITTGYKDPVAKWFFEGLASEIQTNNL